MKLRELADIKQGLSIDTKYLLKEKRSDGIYFQCLQATDFSEGKSYYLYQKVLRKLYDYSTKSFLFYGDYIIYKKGKDFKIYRYDDTSGQTVACNGLFVIAPVLGIIKDFLTFEKNRNYFCTELSKIEREEGILSIGKIGEIEILTDDILELENANKAEQIGIRKPVNIKETPIRLTQKPLPIDKLIKRIQYKELLLDTEFQRRPGLWDISIKSRLIESMIIKLPIPAFYFDGSNDDQWLVIDGLQRLSAVSEFVDEKFELTDLDYLPELHGKSFSKLERAHQRNIEEYEVFAYIIQKGTPKSVTYKVFKNINTSALKLEPQEIRHALNPGVPGEFLREIVSKDWFKKLLLLSDRQKERMEDRETALRFIAFQRRNYSEYKDNIIDFLDSAMTDIYDIPNHHRDLYSKEMEAIFNLLYELLGENAFSRSLFDDSRKFGHNNIMFELITYGVSTVHKEKRIKLNESSTRFRDVIISHFKEKPDRFWEYENAYSIEYLKKRFEEIEQLFKKIMK